jgi:hypothetical protein
MKMKNKKPVCIINLVVMLAQGIWFITSFIWLGFSIYDLMQKNKEENELSDTFDFEK